ncbi:MAG: hypothetical protein ACLPN1_11785 [Dissulfurispiraceae bacterium]
MKKILDLDEATADRLFAILSRYDRKRADRRRGLIKDMIDLRQSVRRKYEVRIVSVLGMMESRARMLQDLSTDERRELKGILSIEQQAKYLIFQAAFAREVRSKISEMRRERKDVSQNAIW